jgi:hypothetical protein
LVITGATRTVRRPEKFRCHRLRQRNAIPYLLWHRDQCINLIAGAIGGAGVGKASPNFDLGTVGNIVSGLVGGGVLGQIVTLALPSVMAAAQSGNLSIGGIISQVVAGGAGGAILTAIIGAIKNKAAA